MRLEHIAARAIKFLKEQDKEITPEEFQKAFCREMKKEGYYHEECDRLPRFIARLDDGYQKLIRNYAPKNINELVQFLISQVNRLNPSEANEYLTAQYVLTLKILKALKRVRHKEMAKLASSTLDKIENTRNIELLFASAREWDSLGANFKSDEFDQIGLFLSLKAYYLDDVALEIKNAFEKEGNNLASLAEAALKALKPSFYDETDKELEEFSKSVLNSPLKLLQRKTQGELERLSQKRVALDNESVRQKLYELGGILDAHYEELNNTLGAQENGVKGIESLKKYIEDGEGGDFDSFKLKLNSLVTALEVDIEGAVLSLKSSMAQMKALRLEVKILESELENAKKEAGTDYLTKIANRKTLDEELDWLEELYIGSDDYNFCIILFEIDDFKEINDSYGHLAGDVALGAFAQIMKKKAKEGDTVGRFANEAFMTILPKASKEEALTFAEEVRVKVEETKFVYKESRIRVSVSAGVAERKAAPNLRELIKAADLELHNARSAGGNRVCPA